MIYVLIPLIVINLILCFILIKTINNFKVKKLEENTIDCIKNTDDICNTLSDIKSDIEMFKDYTFRRFNICISIMDSICEILDSSEVFKLVYNNTNKKKSKKSKLKTAKRNKTSKVCKRDKKKQ